METHEVILEIPLEHERNLFGGLDCHVKKIERTLQVSVILRDGAVKLVGSKSAVEQAKNVFSELLTLSERGNTITEQNVDYVLALSKEHSDVSLAEIDKDLIGYTIQGKPIKPKTRGQQKYVNQIREKMMVFGIGPAGTGKSQIAYAVARILKLPWTTLDMSSINDAEQLTGSSRIYSNAKPGIIMEAFSQAGESNLVFIINELDKASSKNGNGNPADVLLTLLDNLGFTDNYMECMVPTVGVYPIATANDKSQISAPLMSRFAVIDIPDYTDEEKKVIFQRFALRKVFERMGMKEEECVLTEDGLDAVIKLHENTSGIRDLEQAAEHLAANALYQIEVDKVKQVVFDAEAVFELLG